MTVLCAISSVMYHGKALHWELPCHNSNQKMQINEWNIIQELEQQVLCCYTTTWCCCNFRSAFIYRRKNLPLFVKIFQEREISLGSWLLRRWGGQGAKPHGLGLWVSSLLSCWADGLIDGLEEPAFGKCCQNSELYRVSNLQWITKLELF